VAADRFVAGCACEILFAAVENDAGFLQVSRK